jgi:hypothetical protein
LSLVLLLSVIGLLAAAILETLPWAWFLLPILVFGIAVLTGLLQLRAPAKVWAMLSMAQVFVLWKLLLLVKVAIGGSETQWRRTPRDEKS